MKEPKDLSLYIADFLYSKKADNILVLDVAHLTSITDYFLICSVRNTTQCRAIGEELEEKLDKAEGIQARRKEGYRDARWVVLDYGSVIVHIFHEQEREYYNLERLWADGTNLIKSM